MPNHHICDRIIIVYKNNKNENKKKNKVVFLFSEIRSFIFLFLHRKQQLTNWNNTQTMNLLTNCETSPNCETNKNRIKTIKHCLECGKTVSGRSDRKFCDDGCRISYNNRKYRSERETMREFNRILYRNYRILKKVCDDGNYCCHYSYLSRKGFNFEFITTLTNTSPNMDSNVMGCYGINYTIDNKGFIHIRKSEDVTL